MLKTVMSTVYVFYTKFSAELPHDVFANYFRHLPGVLQEANKKYLRWQDRTANLLGKVLLLSGLRVMGLKFSLHDLKFSAFNRPFLNGEVDFSISHSGDYVICALGIGQKLGVDIEEVRTVHLDDFKQVFTQEQFDTIRSAPDPYLEFFKLWTIKESVVKADGRGLSFPLLDIKITGNTALLPGKKWHLQRLDIADNYSASLAHDRDEITFLEYELDCERIMSH